MILVERLIAQIENKGNKLNQNLTANLKMIKRIFFSLLKTFKFFSPLNVFAPPQIGDVDKWLNPGLHFSYYTHNSLALFSVGDW